ncbi:MAG: hypothetical protein AB7U07_17260 [Thermoleophilia bacterium]
MIIRAILLLAGGAALAASIAIERPERFSVTAPCALLVIVVGAGAIAADAVPLRRIPLACSAATLVLGVALLNSRGETQLPLAAAIVVCQVAAAAANWHGGQNRGGASRIVWPR